MKFSTVLRALLRNRKGRLVALALQILSPNVAVISGQTTSPQTLSGYSSRSCDDAAAQDVPACQQAISAFGKQAQDSPERDDSGPALRSLSTRLPKDYNSQLLGPAVGKSLTSRKPLDSADTTTPSRRDRNPQPLSEFQRFISSSVGSVLPIFGQELFEDAPSTFASIDSLPVTSNYIVGPGDEIQLRVWGQVNLDTALTVDRSGMVYVPQVGNVAVAGQEFSKLPAYFRSQLARVFRNFQVDVNLGHLRSIQIFVVGQARHPGTYNVSSLSTVVNAIFASGGPNLQGSMRRIQLRRSGSVISEIDLYDLLLKGDKSQDARLLPGDVVYIPAVSSQIAVSGSVHTPAIFELKGKTSLVEAIGLAGGLTPTADVHMSVERIHDHSAREVLDLEYARASDTPLADGDSIRVPNITARFDNAVTLRGNVANPHRFAWRPGMRLHDIIPNKESLVTRGYWTQRNELALVDKEDPKILDISYVTPQDPKQQRAKNTGYREITQRETRIEQAVAETNWSYAVIERRSQRNLGAQLIPFNLGRLVIDDDEAQNLELRAGDVVTVFSQRDIRVPVTQQHRLVRLEGEFNSPGIYEAEPQDTLADIIRRAGGLTKNGYLYGSSFYRESAKKEQEQHLQEYLDQFDREISESRRNVAGATSLDQAQSLTASLDASKKLADRMRAIEPTGRIVFNLDPQGKDVDSLMALRLEDGDRFVVPAKPGTVSVLGAVFSQSSFVQENDKHVSEYLKEAGGPTRSADKTNMFVIRADGSIVPRNNSSRSGKFDNLELHPGDSLVVPELIVKTSKLREFRDWSQVFTNFALGAAAANVLR
jgi:polysaccharide export outer membrane protein